MIPCKSPQPEYRRSARGEEMAKNYMEENTVEEHTDETLETFIAGYLHNVGITEEDFEENMEITFNRVLKANGY